MIAPATPDRPDTAAPVLWPAPTSGPIDVDVCLPGSKSLTNRALILAAQATGPSTIFAPLVSRDSALMAAALRALGCGVDDIQHDWVVRPSVMTGPADIDCGLAGTVMRFLPPLAATASGDVRLDGDPQARSRPMAVVLEALRTLGARIDGDRLPFVLRGTGGLPGGEVRIDASASSQFVSGLLLSGAAYENGLTVQHVGKPVPSLPHIEMTVQVLRGVGVEVDDSAANTWRVHPGPVRPWTDPIEPDLSNALPFLAAAMITRGTVRIPRWPTRTTQPGDAARWLLPLMGADVHFQPDADRPDRFGTLQVTGTGALHGIDMDLSEVGELAPTICALAALADSPSRLRGIGHLRGHETDRLAALAANLTALGGDARETEDGLAIRPAQLVGGLWPSWADHRMATAGAVIGLRVPGIEVEDIGTTSKTLPDFVSMWTAITAPVGTS